MVAFKMGVHQFVLIAASASLAGIALAGDAGIEGAHRGHIEPGEHKGEQNAHSQLRQQHQNRAEHQLVNDAVVNLGGNGGKVGPAGAGRSVGGDVPVVGLLKILAAKAYQYLLVGAGKLKGHLTGKEGVLKNAENILQAEGDGHQGLAPIDPVNRVVQYKFVEVSAV